MSDDSHVSDPKRVRYEIWGGPGAFADINRRGDGDRCRHRLRHLFIGGIPGSPKPRALIEAASYDMSTGPAHVVLSRPSPSPAAFSAEPDPDTLLQTLGIPARSAWSWRSRWSVTLGRAVIAVASRFDCRPKTAMRNPSRADRGRGIPAGRGGLSSLAVALVELVEEALRAIR